MDAVPEPSPVFAGFPPEALAFLSTLAQTQTREWFQAHKDAYEAHVRAPAEAFVATLVTALVRRGVPLTGDPRRAMFRLNRDVRFSKDKRPYKTNIGIALSRDGVKMSPGILYIHIDPGQCFLASGFYHPAAEHLDRLRDAIATETLSFRAALDTMAAQGLHMSPDEEALKRVPRGFESVTDPVLRDMLRRKSFLFRRKLPQDAVLRAELVDTAAEFAEAVLPFLRFGWGAIAP